MRVGQQVRVRYEVRNGRIMSGGAVGTLVSKEWEGLRRWYWVRFTNMSPGPNRYKRKYLAPMWAMHDPVFGIPRVRGKK